MSLRDSNLFNKPEQSHTYLLRKVYAEYVDYELLKERKLLTAMSSAPILGNPGVDVKKSLDNLQTEISSIQKLFPYFSASEKSSNPDAERNQAIEAYNKYVTSVMGNNDKE